MAVVLDGRVFIAEMFSGNIQVYKPGSATPILGGMHSRLRGRIFTPKCRRFRLPNHGRLLGHRNPRRLRGTGSLRYAGQGDRVLRQGRNPGSLARGPAGPYRRRTVPRKVPVTWSWTRTKNPLPSRAVRQRASRAEDSAWVKLFNGKDLDGCMDAKSPAYRKYFMKSDPAGCRGASLAETAPAVDLVRIEPIGKADSASMGRLGPRCWICAEFGSSESEGTVRFPSRGPVSL